MGANPTRSRPAATEARRSRTTSWPTVMNACEQLRRPQEVVPRPVIRGIRNGRAVQQVPIVHDHQRRIAAGEAVYACTATENREDLRVVAAEVDPDAGEVRCEIEGATAVGERGD